MINGFFLKGCLFWGGVILLILLAIREKSYLHKVVLNITSKAQKYIIFVTITFVIAVCVLPMGLCPHYNGELQNWRNIYEVMTDSILEGHLYIDYGDMDPRLLEMENPYDPDMRKELGVNFHWDHALYKGHYYMYYGIVPVFLVFLPFRIITGTSLTTYHATQIFVGLFIIGIFALFYFVTKKFFGRMSLGMYLFLSSAISIMSVWYSVDAPALYCTAITAGMCLEIWSLYFFAKAVWDEADDNKYILFAFCGSILGALAFGCRPSVALANILVIPMVAEFIKKKNITPVLIRQLIFAASPYVVVAALLMTYNYVRFDNPFEFGQTWQLTSADQSNYGNIFSRMNLIDILNGILKNFISYAPLKISFPYISFNGAYINFPMLLFPVIAMTKDEVRGRLKDMGLLSFAVVIGFLPLLITVITVVETPWLLERYRMDIYWLMGIFCYIMVGCCYMGKTEVEGKKFSRSMRLWALETVFMCFFLYLVPWDHNLTAYDSGVLENIEKVLTFGLK